MGEIKDDQGEADQGEADQGEAEADVDVKEGEVKEEEPDVKVEGGNREEKEEKENEREEGELAEGGSVPEDEVHEVPEVKVPEVKLPDVERVREEGEVDEDEPEDGETKDDDHQLHEVQVAEVNAPEIDVTEVNVPEAEVPETEVQEVQALEAEVPEAKVPLVEDRGAESLHVEHVPSPAVSVETDLEEAKEFRSQKEVAETSLGSADDREEEMQETNGQEPTIKGPSSNPMAGVTFVARSPRKQKYEELGVPYETGTRTLTHDRPDEEEVKETVAEAKVHRKKCKYQPADDIRISKARAQDVQFIWRGGPKGRRIVHQDELLPETQASLEIAKTAS
ncbi:hypothetical protein GNI_158260 [Gregarina niphandrodes]|uniref:Uncharacterized protein n=1 Tax=Gregarina niphandrodes TaxID=110365 RepID=A0A023AZR3_GRENI|nr:hypothetical protein GNI_158260 [Gregarina niphandrodes]EZG43795.1 hypothetical protein GNI_158260 [Gregarina niphandrodes]|eukprot:XP_011133020.1 hypothetical protein GNI_158260 [Gregarina niphandrodes]